MRPPEEIDFPVVNPDEAAAAATQAAYATWGWRKVAQKHNPLPGSPVFDVLVRELGLT